MDSGILSSMTQIPVSELRFGDSASPSSWLEYKLGPLKCEGKEGFYPSEIRESTMTFKMAFHPTSNRQ